MQVFITSRDRLEPLKALVEWLDGQNLYHTITLLNNDSTYPPLLRWLDEQDFRVVDCDNSWGSHSVWHSGEAASCKEPWLLCEDDIVPEDTVPEDWVCCLHQVLERHPEVSKVGFSLRIDDLPDTYPLKEKVLETENAYWEDQAEHGVYRAFIDTAMALYRPGAVHAYEALRLAPPYTARHWPWYYGNPLPEDEAWYAQRANPDWTYYTRHL